MDAEKKILDEFGTWYLADELPPYDERWRNEIMPLWAHQSAGRLGAGLSEAERGELAALLCAIAGDQKHPLVRALSDETGVSWLYDEETWDQLVGILETIARHLTSTSDAASV